MAARNNSSNTKMPLIEDFENAYQAFLAPYLNPTSSHVFDSDELKANVDNVLRFLDISRQIECHFMQKRALFADHKPECILIEEINELRHEINRKDNLINKHHEKLNKWLNLINDVANGKTSNFSNMTGANSAMGPVGPVATGMQAMRPMGAPMANINAMNQMKAQMPTGGMMSQIRPQNPSTMVASPLNSQMQFGGMVNQAGQQQYHGNIPGSNPLASLERTTCNIGVPDTRR